MGAFLDLTGQRFGRWTVLRRADHNNQFNKVLWVCRCDCGNEAEVPAATLRNGTSQSCGCRQADISSARMIKHGQSTTRLYHIWAAMKKRCHNPKTRNFADYGGRGITVCAEWETFEPFCEWAIQTGYDENAPTGEYTLERINNDDGYSPDNCRWATKKEQGNNKRNNRMVVAFGETKTLSQWADEYKIPYANVYSRIAVSGWDAEKALTTPIRK